MICSDRAISFSFGVLVVIFKINLLVYDIPTVMGFAV